MTQQKLIPGRRERKRELTKQGLLKAAFELFVSKGYDETTIDDIVNAADVAKVTFYYYFRSKEDIIQEMKKHVSEEVLGDARKMLGDDANPMVVLDKLVVDISSWTEKNWRVLEVFAAQRFAPCIDKKHWEEEETPPLELLLEKLVVLGQTNNVFRKQLNAQQTARMIMLGIMNESFAWMRKGRQKNTLESGMRSCLDLILNGLKEKS